MPAGRSDQPFELHPKGLMRLKLSPLLLCLVFFPGLGIAEEKTIYGLNEYVRLFDLDLKLAAKLDTGAKTASLSAGDIKRFKRAGEPWVHFYLPTNEAQNRSVPRFRRHA